MSVERALEVIGVEYGVSDEELGRAYRKASWPAHPDRNGGDEEPFKVVSEAYAVLKAEVRRGWQPERPRSTVGSPPGVDVGPPTTHRMQELVDLYMRCFFGGLDPEIDDMAAKWQRKVEEDLKRGRKG
jgi:hypothetical protein